MRQSAPTEFKLYWSVLNRKDKSDEFGLRVTAPGHFATVAKAISTPESGRSFEIGRASRYAWLDGDCVGWGRVGEQGPRTRVGVHNTGPPVFPYVLELM